MINDCSRGRKLQIVLELQCAFWRPVPHAATVRRVIPGSDPQLVLDVAGRLVVSTHVADPPPTGVVRFDIDRPLVFDASGRRLA